MSNLKFYEKRDFIREYIDYLENNQKQKCICP